MKKTPQMKKNFRNTYETRFTNLMRSSYENNLGVKGVKNTLRYNSPKIHSAQRIKYQTTNNFKNETKIDQEENLFQNTTKNYLSNKKQKTKLSNIKTKINFDSNEKRKIKESLEYYNGSFFNFKNCQTTSRCIFHRNLYVQFYIKKQSNQYQAGLCSKCALVYAKKQFNVKEINLDLLYHNTEILEYNQDIQKYQNQIERMNIFKQNFLEKENKFNLQVKEQDLFLRSIVDSILKVVNNCNKHLMKQIQKQILQQRKSIQKQKNCIEANLKELNKIQREFLIQKGLQGTKNLKNSSLKNFEKFIKQIKISNALIQNTSFPDTIEFSRQKINEIQKNFQNIYQNFIQHLFQEEPKSPFTKNNSLSKDTFLDTKNLKKNYIEISSQSGFEQNQTKENKNYYIRQPNFNSIKLGNQNSESIMTENHRLLDNVAISRSYNLEQFEESSIEQTFQSSKNLQLVIKNCMQDIDSICSTENLQNASQQKANEKSLITQKVTQSKEFFFKFNQNKYLQNLSA